MKLRWLRNDKFLPAKYILDGWKWITQYFEYSNGGTPDPSTILKTLFWDLVTERIPHDQYPNPHLYDTSIQVYWVWLT